ncbi:MAG: ABC transporter permease [Dehalococcoidales bacterium]|nr:ABC transporter permease [Dehalococcoidales bacterium]
MVKNISADKPVPVDNTEESAHYSEFRRIVKVFFGRKVAVFGMIVIILLILTAIFAPLLAPYDPYLMDMGHTLEQPSREHLLGTDSLGRDVLSRLIYGSRSSLLVAIGAIGLSAVVGEALGLMAAHFGGIVFNIIMRLTDALMAVPMILLALILASVIGGGLKNVIIALGVGMVPVQCRVMCGQSLSVKQNDYILAARALGMGDMRLMVQEILPNAIPTLLVVTTIGLGTTILAEAGLSFLGIGVLPPEPAWGGMINDGYKFILSNPALSFAPGVAIMLVVFGFNMMGDGLRDALDPRLRGVI